MKKEVLLATMFAKAPLSLQTAANDHSDAIKKFEKAKRNLADATKALQSLEVDVTTTGQVFQKELNAWTPEGLS